MKQMLVYAEPDRTQTAVLEHGKLIEFYLEPALRKQGVGNVYKGKVVNVLPGMQAAFVDIGQGKNAFLYIDDVVPANLEKQPKGKLGIEEVLREGQDIVVQVMKESQGSKGARVTTHYSLPGRYLVYMPGADYIGVSKKITMEPERLRLRQLGEALSMRGEGIIMRTVAENVSAEQLEQDLLELRDCWHSIGQLAATVSAPAELHSEAGLVQRMIRDVLSADTDELWIESGSIYEETLGMVRAMAPQLQSRVHKYEGKPDLFARFGIQEQLQLAFASRIRLGSGGDLVWDQTEALTVIDVNTGKYIGQRDLEDTVFNTNMEAAEEIARLLKLRDIGGIIIIDFIDMEQEIHREAVQQRLEQRLRTDRTKCHVLGWTRLGLLEMTRKKARENMYEQLYEVCDSCKGKGRRFVGLSMD